MSVVFVKLISGPDFVKLIFNPGFVALISGLDFLAGEASSSASEMLSDSSLRSSIEPVTGTPGRSMMKDVSLLSSCKAKSFD